MSAGLFGNADKNLLDMEIVYENLQERMSAPKRDPEYQQHNGDDLVLWFARGYALKRRDWYVYPEDLFLGILSRPESVAAQCLEEIGVSYEVACRAAKREREESELLLSAETIQDLRNNRDIVTGTERMQSEDFRPTPKKNEALVEIRSPCRSYDEVIFVCTLSEPESIVCKVLERLKADAQKIRSDCVDALLEIDRRDNGRTRKISEESRKCREREILARESNKPLPPEIAKRLSELGKKHRDHNYELGVTKLGDLPWLIARTIKSRKLGAEHLLLAILRYGKGTLAKVFASHNITYESAKEAVIELQEESENQS